MDHNDHSESEDTNGDGEGVWSPDIEQCFREALLLFPPCGRRKHILQEEGGGKMYGRNELIARHIMMRTGKSRTRKQVSSHIQVLARRKAKAESIPTSSSGLSTSPSSTNRSSWPQSTSRHDGNNQNQQNTNSSYMDVWNDRPVATQKIRLVEFSAFIEYRNFQSPTLVARSTAANQQPAPLMSQASLSTSTNTTQSDLLPVGEQDLSLQTQAYPNQRQSQTLVMHPLASNHHLSAQFNQASYQSEKLLSPLQKSRASQGTSEKLSANANADAYPNQQAGQSAGFTRHSYVCINYSQPASGQVNKLERIDISQIQDKFPEISGSEGLFQRGPSDAFFLVKFWADLTNEYEYNADDQNSFFGFSSRYETIDSYKDITCSTKVCSYGLQVVEKVEKIYGAFNSLNGRFSFDITRSPMCEFMIQFIKKLRQLPRSSQMNSVLENFTVLQVISCESTSEILLCLAYVFEIAPPEQINGPQYHVYKLARD